MGKPWVRRFQDTGSVAPDHMGGHKPKAIAGEHHEFMARRVRKGGLRQRQASGADDRRR